MHNSNSPYPLSLQPQQVHFFLLSRFEECLIFAWKTSCESTCLFFLRWIDASPVDDEGQRPLHNVVEGKGLQAAEGELCGVCTDDGLLLLCFYGQYSQELRDEVMGHQVDL